MANERQPDPSGFTAETDIDLVLGSANPNPTRAGCPSDEILAALARRERPIDDSAYDHLTKCSPCYRAVRSLQQAAGERRTTTSASRAWRLAAAAVLIFGVLGAGWFAFQRDRLGHSSTEVHAQLDLRPYAIMRSGEPQDAQTPLVVPHGHLALTLLLPAGAEPGPYEVQLLDANLTSRASANGDAEVQNRVTTLRTLLDARGLSAGDYKLAVRHMGDDWQMFPAQVR